MASTDFVTIFATICGLYRESSNNIYLISISDVHIEEEGEGVRLEAGVEARSGRMDCEG